MDIPRDLRRKMIIKLIEALKESPSFCNISDSQLNEAVLNSEHQTFQLCKSKDEYMAHINEKLRKIKQSVVIKNEEKNNESRNSYQKSKYEDDRGKIINGNIPAHVKISQIYSQDTPYQPSGNMRKVDSFSNGFERQGRIYGTEQGSNEPAEMQYAGDQKYYNRQAYGYYNGYYPSKPIMKNQEVMGGASLYSRAPCGDNIPQVEVRNSKPKNSSFEQVVDFPPEETPGRFSNPNNPAIYFPSSGVEASQYQERGNFYNTEQKPFQNAYAETQKKMAGMFTTPTGKFKTDMYSDKHNIPGQERFYSKPTQGLSDLENDTRLVRNPSFINEQASPERFNKSVPPAQNRPVLKKNPVNTGFEYSYNNSFNKSFVGNINPGLMSNSTETQKSKPFDEKKSEELFKSFSEEFMKSSKSNAQIVIEPLEASLGLVEDPGVHKHSPTEFASDSTDEYDDQIPEKLQVFLDANQLSLKEIGNVEEWRGLLRQVTVALKNETKAVFPFKTRLEIQNEFIEFPFCDETDLKGFLENIERARATSQGKTSKDDYFDYIDKAIEAFSEKKRNNSGFFENSF